MSSEDNSPTEINPRNSDGIQVISRAASILRALQADPAGLSLGEIAAIVNLPRSTVQRIVNALIKERLLMAASPTVGVRLGPALLGLAASTRFPINELARPTLEALALDTGESVVLTVFDREGVSVIDGISAPHRLASVLKVGTSLPWHCSASGKAMVASLGTVEIRELRRKSPLVRHTANTFVAWEPLRREIESIRRSGVSFDREEHTLGVVSAAVSVCPPSGELAAIAVTAPSQRFAEAEAELVEKLRKHAHALQRRFDTSS